MAANHDDARSFHHHTTYNEEALIASTLESLRTYLTPRPEQYEIIVVDDGSQAKTVASIKEWRECNKADVRLLINRQNMGKGLSVQRGVGAVEYFALVLSHLSS